MGAGIYVPALYVPVLLVSHVLIFLLLLKVTVPGSASNMDATTTRATAA
jgi:hypothetical protein